MNILYKLTTILFILFTSCSIKQEDTLLKGELLYEDKADQRYYDLELTESYLILLAQNSDSIIQVFKKEKPDKLYAFAPKGYGDTYFSKPEFMKSNSKDPAEKDEVWIVDNQLSFNKIRIKETLFFKREPLFYELYSSTYYNVTTQETYAVPFGKEKTLAPFYFANDEKGVYWVEYSKAETRYRNCHALAYLPALCVNESANSVAAAKRFFNQVHFYDLKGKHLKSFTYGDHSISPLLKANNKEIDVAQTTKCFIDIYGTKRYVYCLYDGSSDFSASSTLLIFTWSGELKRTLHLDRNLKKIAIDPYEETLVALIPNEQGGKDVVRYRLK